MMKDSRGRSGLTEPHPLRDWVKHWWFWLPAAILLGIVVYSQLTKDRAAEAPARPGASLNQPGVAVTAASAKKGDIGIYLTGLGTVTPVHTVTVKSRVDGELMKVYYQEGQIVNKGASPGGNRPPALSGATDPGRGPDDPRPGPVEERQDRPASATGSCPARIPSPNSNMTPRSPWCASLRAPSSSTRGRSTTPNCRLIYARITAPGQRAPRAAARRPGQHHSRHRYHRDLAVITQLEPITVIFTIPEDNLPPVLAKLRAGVRLPVEAYNREQTKKTRHRAPC